MQTLPPVPRSAAMPLVLAALALTLGACAVPETEPFDLDESDFPEQADNTPADNPQTSEGVALGRVLFYDVLLSRSLTVSCASCHQQEHAFSDPQVTSEGFDGGRTRRNSMPLVNVRFYEPGRMFWEERAATLEEQVLMPIFDEVEMGLTESELVERVAMAGYYAPLFAGAFGDEAVSSERISQALAQFVRSLVSTTSRFDEAVAANGSPQGDLPGLTVEENRGKALFFSGRTQCARCHLRGGNGNGNGNGNQGGRGGPGGPGNMDDGTPGGLLAAVLPPPPPAEGAVSPFGGAPPENQLALFFVNGPAHNGLSIENGDQGVFEVTGDPEDIGRFKSPSLRNVELTGPYMHDGRFETLDQVIDHYNSGLVDHENLDNRLRANGEPRRMNLNEAERAALVAFLKTLTDSAMLTDPRFSDPFEPADD